VRFPRPQLFCAAVVAVVVVVVAAARAHAFTRGKRDPDTHTPSRPGASPARTHVVVSLPEELLLLSARGFWGEWGVTALPYLPPPAFTVLP
jgi:hypothetical protein